MPPSISSPMGFVFLLLFFGVGSLGALIFKKNDELSNKWSGFFAVAGSLWGVVFALTTWAAPQALVFTAHASPFPLIDLSVNIDRLSAFFIFTISLVALFCSLYGVGYVRHYYKQYSIGVLGFFYNLFIIGMLLVVTAANALFFLAAWELMSLASYFLVIYDRKNSENVSAGFLYLVMTHVGTAFIVLLFILLYGFTGSFDFAAARVGTDAVPLFIKNIIFVLAMVGFGTKAGIIPLHIWLPSAHPAAPSHVSALMSGVMIKTGIYMMIRIFMDMLQPIPSWWGIVVLIVGSVSALLGVLYALTEHDIKRLLAYHSIENIGIILLGLGSALIFAAQGMMPFALLGLAAALFHTLNHAVFKSLLFLGAGSVINQTHTRNMEEYGGLIRYMPQTALFFFVGSMAISALPPFNGFFSEWLTFQALFQGIVSLDAYARWAFIAAAGSLAFTGGLALACFVKAFGAIFLARPRSPEVAHAKEGSLTLLLGMGGLAVLSLLLGMFSGSVTAALRGVARSLVIFREAAPLLLTTADGRITVGNFASVSGLTIAVILTAAFALTFIVAKYLVRKDQKVILGATWDCGVDLTPRTEITSVGFARSIIMIFKSVLKPSIQHEIEYHDAESRYLPKSSTVVLGISDTYRAYLYKPLHNFVSALSGRVRRIQSGNINAYILYIFIALLATLIFAM